LIKVFTNVSAVGGDYDDDDHNNNNNISEQLQTAPETR
jgi:hypothetical protein